MNPALERYLARTAVFRWPLCDGDGQRLNSVVVIPALAESAHLFKTLEDLAANDPLSLARTLVLVVVNNRSAEIAGQADAADNQRTLAALPGWKRAHPGLRLAWIDASSPGKELDAREGVGLARKIGLDWGLRLLVDSNQPEGALVCLDADTRVASGYLGAIQSYYRTGGRWAAVVDYAHPLEDGAADESPAIVHYEIFLRYCELGLRHARSPYAYPAIGSTITCTAAAYAVSGGMKRSQAGEDFYFLEKLAKTGPIGRIHETAVAPSPRVSHRVPFGTGRSMQAFATGADNLQSFYNPRIYGVLREWLALITEEVSSPPGRILKQAERIDGSLAEFLGRQRFVEQMGKLQANAPDGARLLAQFHRWFDAFRTMKCIHHLRDSTWPQRPLVDAVDELLHMMELPQPPASLDGRSRLYHLRDLCRNR